MRLQIAVQRQRYYSHTVHSACTLQFGAKKDKSVDFVQIRWSRKLDKDIPSLTEHYAPLDRDIYFVQGFL